MVAATTSPSQLVEVLEDLSTRFILNLPPSELSSIPRIIFQVEQAYWYYSDHVQPSFPTTLPTCTLKTFSSLLFQVCPLLEKWEPEHERVFVEFMQYKSRVPVCGAILVGEGWDKVLMVRGWKGSTWGWPKGKINQNEAKHVCAAREVLEETGYDPSALLDPKHFIELTIQDQRITLFIVPHVPLAFPFLTQTRKEIGAIEWFRLKDLPGWKKRAPGSGVVDDKERATYSRNASGNKFYLTTPFVGQLKKWIKTHKPLASSALAPPSPPTNGLPSPTLTPTPISPSLPRAEIEGPEGGTKENRISELDELFERFLKDNTGDQPTPSSSDPRAGDSDDEQRRAVSGALEGGNRLNELLAGLRVREDTASTATTSFSTDTATSSSSSAPTPNRDNRQLSTPPLHSQHLYNHHHHASQQPPPAQQRLDDPRTFPPPPSGYAPSPQHQSASPSSAQAQSHGSLLSLLQSQPPFFGTPSTPSSLAAAAGGAAPVSPPGAKADKERRLLDLLESSLQATEVEPSTPRYATQHALPGSPQVAPLHHPTYPPSPYAAQQVPNGLPYPAPLQPQQPQPQQHQHQQQRRTNLLDILNTGNGSERGMRDGLHFDQPARGSPLNEEHRQRTPTSHHGLGQTTSYSQPSAAFNAHLGQPSNSGFALPPPPPPQQQAFSSPGPAHPSHPIGPAQAQAQSQALLAMLSSPPPSHPNHQHHQHQPHHLSNGSYPQAHASPTPPPATLSTDKQSLLNLLSSPPPAPRTGAIGYPTQHGHLQPQQMPERAPPHGERERLLLGLLGGPSAGSPVRDSRQQFAGSPSASAHQQHQRPQDFPPSLPGYTSFGAPPPQPHYQQQQQPPQQQQQPPQQQQQPQGLQQIHRPVPLAPSPARGGQASGLLSILNASPATGGRGGRIAQMDVPGFPTGSPMMKRTAGAAPSGLPGSLAAGRGVNGLPLFGI